MKTLPFHGVCPETSAPPSPPAFIVTHWAGWVSSQISVSSPVTAGFLSVCMRPVFQVFTKGVFLNQIVRMQSLGSQNGRNPFAGTAPWGCSSGVGITGSGEAKVFSFGLALFLTPCWGGKTATDPISDSDQSIAAQKSTGPRVRSSGF